MSSLQYTNVPTWLIKPSEFHNVISNQLSSIKEIPSCIQLADSFRFNSGLKQALFWRKRLVPSTSPHTVIFSFLGPQGLILPNVLEVCQALKNVCDMLHVTEIYRATNSNFIGISFSNTTEAAKIRSHFSYFKDNIVVHVPLSVSTVHHFKLLWLPPLFPDSRIHHFLDKHSAFHQFKRELTLTDTDIYSPTNAVFGTLRLHPKTDVTQLPHVIPLPAPYMGFALLIISGRPSYCLRCGQTGHIRRTCPTPRCSSCHMYHLTSTSCSPHNSTLDPALSDLWDPDAIDLPPISSSNILPNKTSSTASSDNQAITSATQNHCLDKSIIPHIDITLESNTSTVLIDNHISSSPNCDRTPEPTFAIISENTSSSFQSSPTTLPSQPSASHTAFTSSDTHTSPATIPFKLPLKNYSKPKAHSITTPIALHNPFDSLVDEANNMIIDTLIDEEPSHPHSIKDTSLSSITSIVLDHTLVADSFTAPDSHHTLLNTIHRTDAISTTLLPVSTNNNSSSQPSRKRHKTATPEDSPISSPAPFSAPLSTSPSWAEQVEDDLPTSSHSSPSALDFDHLTTLHSIEPQPTTVFSSSAEPVLSSDDHLDSEASDQSDSSSDHLESSFTHTSSSLIPNVVDPNTDPDLFVVLSGFPQNSKRAVAVTFLGSLVPAALWHAMGPYNTFIGRFGAMFSSPEQVTLATSMNGKLHLDRKICIQRFKRPNKPT